MTEVVEAEVVEHESQETGAALIPTVPAQTLAVTPQVKASELTERLDVIREAADQAMEKDVDYGKVPGTDKPTLFKPGAEKLSVLFQLDVQLDNEKRWEGDEHLTVVSHATVFHAPSGARLGYGEGVCTTREKKYAKRKADLKCPDCEAETVKRSKREEGFYCWAKIGGCGAKFSAGDERITGQPAGEVDNPDLPDCWNTVVKMAEKRARVDAVLAVTGASALFTQDVEDLPQGQAATQAQSKPATGFASDRQRNFAERLLKEAGFNEQGTADVAYFMSRTMSRSDISKTIDKLKEESTRTATADELGREAEAFAAKVAAEDEGVPAPKDPDAEGHSEDIPF